MVDVNMDCVLDKAVFLSGVLLGKVNYHLTCYYYDAIVSIFSGGGDAIKGFFSCEIYILCLKNLLLLDFS
jgi:hypothetical protein